MAGEQCSICLEALDGGEVALAWCRDRSAVVAPDMARDPTAPTSKFWGVSWKTNKGRWLARYTDANGKSRTIGYFDDQEAAALAVNKAIIDAGLAGLRRMNEIDEDGMPVPRPWGGGD